VVQTVLSFTFNNLCRFLDGTRTVQTVLSFVFNALDAWSYSIYWYRIFRAVARSTIWWHLMGYTVCNVPTRVMRGATPSTGIRTFGQMPE